MKGPNVSPPTGPMERGGCPLPPGAPSAEAGDEGLAVALVMQLTAILRLTSTYGNKHHRVELSL